MDMSGVKGNRVGELQDIYCKISIYVTNFNRIVKDERMDGKAIGMSAGIIGAHIYGNI